MDKIKAFTLELPEYREKKPEDCKTNIDYWLYILTNMETMSTQIPFQQQQPIFSKVANISELCNMTREELDKYNISIDSYRTNLSAMKNERAEGRAEGESKMCIEIARKMKSEGLPTELISKMTSLSLEEINLL